MESLRDGAVLVLGVGDPVACRQVQQMVDYGTQVGAGIAPKREDGEVAGIPCFDLVEQAVEQVGDLRTAVILGSAHQVLDGALEAMAAGIRQLIVMPAGVPPLDMVRLLQVAEQTDTLVVGPHSAGVLVPGSVMLGSFPTRFYGPGPVGIMGRSSGLGFEVAALLSQKGLGQSVAVCLGADAMMGSSFAQWVQFLEEDEATQVIVLLGELGGMAEEEAAQTIADQIEKPVIAYVAGQKMPLQHYLGIASTTLDPGHHERGSAIRKIEALKRVGVWVVEDPHEIPEVVGEFVGG